MITNKTLKTKRSRSDKGDNIKKHRWRRKEEQKQSDIVSATFVVICSCLLLPQSANGDEVSNEFDEDEDVMEFWILGACGLGSILTVCFLLVCLLLHPSSPMSVRFAHPRDKRLEVVYRVEQGDAKGSASSGRDSKSPNFLIRRASSSFTLLNRILLAPFGANKSSAATVSPVVVITNSNNEDNKNKTNINKDRDCKGGRDNDAFEMEQQEQEQIDLDDNDQVIVCNEITETTAL